MNNTNQPSGSISGVEAQPKRRIVDRFLTNRLQEEEYTKTNLINLKEMKSDSTKHSRGRSQERMKSSMVNNNDIKDVFVKHNKGEINRNTQRTLYLAVNGQ